MSVLNQSGEEQVECPLCMEPLEVDDLNFFPCTCGYQICRFCWHRIRTDENGLCPACRKAYSENPADFTPLSKEQVAQLKAEKRQRDQQRKAKLSESRKHLANVRVVQKNLVFVVGLPMRLADAEVLKRHEYFGKFGKIQKVVINQSTSYAGSQGPSASAYVTYIKSDDALRAIQSVNNITIDGRLIKSSLGTTKYCSHFMKNQSCPKPDCMYLHDFGDPEASFTKEQMHAGKHQEYERKLHERLSGLAKGGASANVTEVATSKHKAVKSDQTPTTTNSTTTTTSANSGSKDSWPQLSGTEKKEEKKGKGKKNKGGEKKARNRTESKSPIIEDKASVTVDRDCGTRDNSSERQKDKDAEESNGSGSQSPELTASIPKIPLLDDNSSFFSQNTFQKISPEPPSTPDEHELLHDQTSETNTQVLNDSLPTISSTEDWEAAFKPSLQIGEALKMIGRLNDFYPPPPNGTFDDGLALGMHKNDAAASPSAAKSAHHDFTFPPRNGLDQMSKFFNDFQQNQPQQNGLLNSLADKQNLLYLQQRQIEEQLRNIRLYNQQQQQLNNMHNGYQYMNGDSHRYGGNLHQTALPNDKGRAEDELDFDPFHETQKALAELIETEQNHKAHNTGRSIPTNQMNGMVHSQGVNGHIPPPPPGFVHTSTHMNSFGSKFFPFLNMNNSQQQTQNNWPGSYNNQMQQHHNKGMNTCNDWKVLDPAIVSSSRHFPLANMQLHEPQLQSVQAQTRPFECSGGFASYTPPNHHQYGAGTYQHLNWLGGEVGGQISSPPGFRSAGTAAKQQQEC